MLGLKRSRSQENVAARRRRGLAGVVLLFLVGLVSLGLTEDLVAQSGVISWTTPEPIRQPEIWSRSPATLVADTSGQVHVVWTENQGGDPAAPGAYDTALYYKRWDGQKWTEPNDIFVSLQGGSFWSPELAIDSNNVLHLAWFGDDGRIYYGQAPAQIADQAQAWTKPTDLAKIGQVGASGKRLVADRHGGLHLVYGAGDPDVGAYYRHSPDGGATWSEPIQLHRVEPSFRYDVMATFDLVADDKNRIHATWTEYTPESRGRFVYYVRSTDGGETWSEPEVIAQHQEEEAGVLLNPVLAVINGDEVHLLRQGGIYNWFEHISTDGGVTWSGPYARFPTLMGGNGSPAMVVDHTGKLHLFLANRTIVGQQAGIYYATWIGQGWSDPAPTALLGTPEDYRDVNLPSATLTNDGKAFVTWLDSNRSGHSLWTMAAQLAVPAIPPVPLPALAPTAGVTPSAVTEAYRQSTPTATATPAPAISKALAEGPSTAAGAPSVLLASLIPGALLVLGIVIFQVTRRRNR